jgi:hypothetical protein
MYVSTDFSIPRLYSVLARAGTISFNRASPLVYVQRPILPIVLCLNQIQVLVQVHIYFRVFKTRSINERLGTRANTNNIALQVGFVIEGRGLSPSPHRDATATNNIGFGTGGGFPVQTYWGMQNNKGGWGTYSSAKIPTCAPRTTTYHHSGNVSVTGGTIG